MASGAEIVVAENSENGIPKGQEHCTPRSPCPWANALKMNSPPATNLSDIMSEELANSLSADEEDKFLKTLLSPNSIAEKEQPLDLSALCEGTDDCNSDFLIAQMLQMQFNKEYDTSLKRVEQKYNGGSKG